MSSLASLVRAYDRMAAHGKVPAYGFSRERIGFLIPLYPDGRVAHEPIDLRQGEGKKKTAPLMAVPASFKRPGVTPRPFFLWDNSAFALGVTASEGKDGQTRWQAFHDRHLRDLSGNQDEGLQALLSFIGSWAPEHFSDFGWPEDMKDQNIVFALESERLANIMIHDRPAARELWARLIAADEKSSAACLITGDHAPVARLHPAIKGVWGAQTAGASIVSFNLDAFTSYGHEQGDNAPVSEAAAFAYTSALNHFLERDSGHRIQVGDSSTVFWADSSDVQAALEAESLFLGFVDEKDAEAVVEKKIEAILAKLRAGRPIAEFKPDLPQGGVRFFVLALAPNAARLSVRFYIEDDFGVIAERYLRHLDRLRIDPPPRDEAPSMWRMLVETAVLRKSDNIQPNLAGEWMRAILTDSPYPLTLLSTLIMRLRADHDVNALRVAILKSILIKNFKMEVPVSLDPECKEPGYLLGRLFAVYEQIQTAALGRNVNATIKDKFYGSAAAQPRKVFRMLESGSANHLAKIGKQRPGLKVNLEKAVGAIMEAMSPDDDPFPASLPEKSQALFGLGYYHQRNEFFKKSDKSRPEEAA
jgi:CRISPR-associated protein Csd1